MSDSLRKPRCLQGGCMMKQQADGAEGAAGTETVSIKEEPDVEATEGHSHTFQVKFKRTKPQTHDIHFSRAGTVLQTIKKKLTEKYEEMGFTDGNIVIQLGEGDKEFAVATHFPCSCIEEGETLILEQKEDTVEASQDQRGQTVHSRDEYSVFYIDTVGGSNTKSKQLFKNNVFKEFKYLCVYGKKGITVEDALKRDGRFLDLGKFKLSKNESPNKVTERTQQVEFLHGHKFKVCLPRGAKPETPKSKKKAAAGSQSKTQEEKVFAGLKQKLAVVTGKDVSIDEIREMLREQFPDLKALMERRFSGLEPYKEALKLRREDFGKIQHAFSEVHRIMKLMKLGESVCKVIVMGRVEGTGFVLFDNFILTNAHLLKGCIEEEKLRDDIEVRFEFNYVEPEPHTDNHYFELAHKNICYRNDGLDYAILEINPQAKKPVSTTPAEQIEVPPGLLRRFGPKPPDGQGCIVGHPAGGLKKMDPICIIEKEDREQAIKEDLGSHKDDRFVLNVISNGIKNDPLADVIISYKTFMYHGASGSPVFDVDGGVFGLHTAGFHFGFNKSEHSLIEFGQPLLVIFHDFVRKFNEELLKRVKTEAQGNRHLKPLLESVTVPETQQNQWR